MATKIALGQRPRCVKRRRVKALAARERIGTAAAVDVARTDGHERAAECSGPSEKDIAAAARLARVVGTKRKRALGTNALWRGT